MNEHRSKIATAGWITRRARLDLAFWDRIGGKDDPEGCWLWLGARQTPDPEGNGGYGILHRHRKVVYAHRRALELSLGRPLEPGEQALHRCDNPPCCNPAHLYAGTNADNVRDSHDRSRRRRPRPCSRCGAPHMAARASRCPACQAIVGREKRGRAYEVWKLRGGLDRVKAARRDPATRLSGLGGRR